MDRRDLPWHFLINPAAARGRKRKRWERDFRILQAELPRMTWAESRAEPGMAALAEAAVRAGHQFLVGVGGDGTHHDILNGIIAAGGLERVTYCPFPSGTGNDWVRTLGITQRLEDWLAVLRYGQILVHRVGRLIYSGSRPGAMRMSPPETFDRYFLNVAGMAYDAEVVRRSERLRFKHRLLYPFLTLAFLRDYTAPTVLIVYNGETFTGPVHTVNFGIGRYSGGGMRLVPHADPAADTLALTFARRLPVWKILAESWRFYTGTIGAVREVTLAHVEEVTVTPLAGRLELEADGEWLGEGKVRVMLSPYCLRVIQGGGSAAPT